MEECKRGADKVEQREGRRERVMEVTNLIEIVKNKIFEITKSEIKKAREVKKVRRRKWKKQGEKQNKKQNRKERNMMLEIQNVREINKVR